MGNTIKLVSGFILFVIGILIAYETSVYNLVDILLMVGFIIAIIGLVMVVSYFVDSNADKTTNILKDFLNSNNINSYSFNRFDNSSNKSNGPLKVRNEFNDDYDDLNYDELVVEDYENPSPREYFNMQEIDDSKAVLNVVNRPEKEINFDNQLNFTPNYEKPLKVTRAPKRREVYQFDDEIPVVHEDKSSEIQRALREEPNESIFDTTTQVAPEVAENRDIKIDINDPESLPVPKLLRSYVICNGGVVTSQEAFDQLAVHVNKEIMLEIPSLNDLSDRFLSHVPTIYSRVIIDEFDVSDMSYMFLISSLLKQGVHIKTVPKVHTVNLITDDSHAMIISEGQNDMEYGAIYDDRNSISNIRSDFERTWDIASNLDEQIVLNTAGGTA